MYTLTIMIAAIVLASSLTFVSPNSSGKDVEYIGPPVTDSPKQPSQK